jgi:hypothetical protein
MTAVKVGSSWRIKTEWGGFEGWYMTKAQADKGIAKRIRQRTENTLPTMETVAADRAQAIGEAQADELTARLKSPLPSITRTCGDIEMHSPLFRESPANPQQDLFQTAEVHPSWDEPLLYRCEGDFTLSAPEPLPAVSPTIPRADARRTPYSGPFPRKRHYHRCPRCKDHGSNGTNCYKSQCTIPVLMSNPCSWCR